MQAVRPLPTISAESFTTANGIAPSPSPIQADASPAATQAQITVPNSDIFTLHDRSRASRKRKAEDDLQVDGEEIHSDESPVTPISYTLPGQGSAAVSAERLSAKEQRKAEKRSRKAAKLEEQERKAREMVPFDYDGAESMLEPKNATNGDSPKGKSKNKPMNPFAKALDTGTGARRNKLGQEGAGRSMTFKS